MAAREVDKKKWELQQCQPVATQINKECGTDYAAYPGDAEPADVTFKSKTNAHVPLSVQVVSIPLDFRHREDKGTVANLQRNLTESLTAKGLSHCVVGIILSGKAEMRGFKKLLTETLTNVIFHEARQGNSTLRHDDIYRHSPELSEYVHDILISHHEVVSGVEIDIPAGSALPPDGRWIEEGIFKKVEKYGGTGAVKDLVLVIGVAGFVDDEQIAAFQKAYPPDTLPFGQIWIVTPFHGVVCLKR